MIPYDRTPITVDDVRSLLFSFAGKSFKSITSMQTDKGTMYTVTVPYDINRDEFIKNVNGNMVLIDGVKHKVKAIESFTRINIHKGEEVGLLVW